MILQGDILEGLKGIEAESVHMVSLRLHTGECGLRDYKLPPQVWDDLGGCEHECGEEPVPCVVLDPFIGSGTVGKVAQALGRDWIGIELNPDYCEMARKRTMHRQEALRLG